VSKRGRVQREPGATVVVVGAGLIGLAIGYELARRGATVHVIDANEPGHAASWAGAGMLAPYTEMVGPPAFRAFCLSSLERYPGFVADLLERGGVDARLQLDGIVETAYDEASEARLRARPGTRWLARDELRFAEPALGPSVRGGALCEAEGQVDNRRLGRALLAASAALGVRVDARAGPVAVEADSRRVLGVRGPLGFVPAGAVVNAAGAWSGALEGVPEHARVPVTPAKGQMLALAMPRGLVRRVLWVPGAYLVPRDDGRLLVGATVESAGFDVRVTARGMRLLLEAALAAAPALGDLAIAESWSGLRPASVDGLPYIGATSLGGYYVATGHYRNGILLTPATAELVADILEGRSDGIPAFSPLRAHEARAAVEK
jgi:glycine oxidase